MKVLITGFGPFMGIEKNVSERIARDIEKGWGKEGVDLEVLITPVEWTATEALIKEKLAQCQPDLIIALGHGDPCLTLEIESLYFNKAEWPDNTGKEREGGVIDQNGPAEYKTNIDPETLAARLLEVEVPAVAHDLREEVKYLCNFAGYIIAHAVYTWPLLEHAKFVFVHIPAFKDLDREISLRGIEETLNFLTEEIGGG